MSVSYIQGSSPPLTHFRLQDYPIDIAYFVVAIIGLATALNILSIFWAFYRRHTMRRGPVSAKPTSSAGQISLLRLPSALLTASRIFAFRLRLPAIHMSLLETLLTCIYLMALLIWQFANSECAPASVPSDMALKILCFLPAQDLVIKDWSDRSGHIAAAQLPLIMGLSMKNNVIGCESR